MATPRLHKTTVKVLEVLLSAEDDDPLWGYRILLETGIRAGTVYPILSRFLIHDWVETWKEADSGSGLPPRRFYRLTEQGRLAADVALKERAARQARIRLKEQKRSPH